MSHEFSFLFKYIYALFIKKLRSEKRKIQKTGELLIYNNKLCFKGDHPGEEGENLIVETETVKSVISNPKCIYCDKAYDKNLRHRYIDLIVSQKHKKMLAMVVIVDTDRTPNEVVTWTIKRKLNQENLDGGIIYVRDVNK